MANNKDRTLEFDMRPRLDETAYRKILEIAKREGRKQKARAMRAFLCLPISRSPEPR